MSDQNGPGITEVARQLTAHFHSSAGATPATAEALRNTLYDAEAAGILGKMADTIETHSAGDADVKALADVLRDRMYGI